MKTSQRVERPGCVIRLVGAACLFAVIAAASLGTPDPAASNTTALEVTAISAPQRVHGSDGREHIDYDLVITNSFTAEVTLTSLVVRGGGKELLTLSGDALAAAIRPFGIGGPTASIPASSSVVAYVDIVLPRSAGRTVPKRIRNRITYTVPAGAPVEAIIGSRTVNGPDLRVDRRAPIVVAPPLRGGGWLSANACCDPSLNHRSTILSANGTYVAPETFAVDYIRLVNGRFYGGDGTQNTDWYGYGAPIRAVASGRVVSVVNDRPEVPPFVETADNPTVTEPSHFGGNGVVVKIRPGEFAHYYHLQPGSVRVRGGQRVRTGQKLGLFGNSGNTQGAHLHFGITDGPHPLTSDSLPFEIDRFRFEGTAAAGPTPGELTLTGKPHDEHRSHPLATSVSDYSR
jgi:murein DD-endopeptidase MepM/ murein hydrolase activator NlpD